MFDSGVLWLAGESKSSGWLFATRLRLRSSGGFTLGRTRMTDLVSQAKLTKMWCRSEPFEETPVGYVIIHVWFQFHGILTLFNSPKRDLPNMTFFKGLIGQQQVQ